MRTGRYDTLAHAIASALDARLNCIKSDNVEWRDKHEATLNALADLLPSGSGIDNGTSINWQRSTGDRIVLDVPFHYMDPNGYYAGWYDYTVKVTPAFCGVSVQVTGRETPNGGGTKDYLAEMYQYLIGRPVTWQAEDGSTDVKYAIEHAK